MNGDTSTFEAIIIEVGRLEHRFLAFFCNVAISFQTSTERNATIMVMTDDSLCRTMRCNLFVGVPPVGDSS